MAQRDLLLKEFLPEGMTPAKLQHMLEMNAIAARYREGMQTEFGTGEDTPVGMVTRADVAAIDARMAKASHSQPVAAPTEAGSYGSVWVAGSDVDEADGGDGAHTPGENAAADATVRPVVRAAWDGGASE